MLGEIFVSPKLAELPTCICPFWQLLVHSLRDWVPICWPVTQGSRASPLAIYLVLYRKTRSVSNTQQSRDFFSYVQPILLFFTYSYVKSHLDNDSCLPICKTIPAISNTPSQTHSVWNYIFLHFIMVIQCCGQSCSLWLARCNLAVSVGIVPTIIMII